MAIQMRRGLRADFDPYKMLPGEWAVSIDPSTSNQIVWMCFSPGVCKRMGTYEDFVEQVKEATADVKTEYSEEFDKILDEIKVLSSQVSDDKDAVVSIKTTIEDEYLPQIQEALLEIQEKVSEAKNSVDAAAVSAENAKKSEVNAKNSETKAKTSETNAATSESNAKISETNAATSATTAMTKATDAANYASNAETSALTATNKAIEASQYAEEAAESAKQSQISSDAAAVSEANAKTSEANAKTYAEQAKAVSGEQATLNRQTLGYNKKNLLKNTAVSSTINDVTFTVNDDGSVTIKGTATKQARLYFKNNLVFDEDTILSIEGATNGGVSGWYSGGNVFGSEKTVPAGTPYGEFFIFVNAGVTVNNVTVYPMIRSAEITDGTYEPYVDDVDKRLKDVETEIGEVSGKVETNAEAIEELRSDVSINASNIEEMATMDVLTNNLGEWKTPTTIPEVWSASKSRLNAIAYGDGRFVGVGDSGLISYSDDGDTWHSVSNSEITADLLGIAYGNGKFVVVSADLYAYYSDNGETWSKVSLGYESLCKIVYGNGIFIAISNSVDDHIMKYSEDGVAWTTYNAGADGYRFVDITYGNGMFVACTDSTEENNIYYSEDGIAWNISTCYEELKHITYGNGKFIGISYANKRAYYSNSGITWVYSGNSLPIDDSSALAYGNGKFVIVNKDGYWSYSEDGLTWETPEEIGSVSLYGLIYANGKFVTVGSSSSDGNIVYYTEYQTETKTIKESVVELQKTVDTIPQLKTATASGKTTAAGLLVTTLSAEDIMITSAYTVGTANDVTPYVTADGYWAFRVLTVGTSFALVKSKAVKIKYAYFNL